MKVIYQTVITKIGDFARDALEEKMLITFKQGAPEDLEDYCFIHRHDELKSTLQIGDRLKIGSQDYKITSVGGVASFNLKELGHITLRFDSATIPEYPGTVHLDGDIPAEIDINTVLTIYRN